MAAATVSTRALPRSRASTSLLRVVSLFAFAPFFLLVVSFWGVVTYRNSASGSSPITRRTWGSRPRIALGISARLGRRYTRGTPPLAGMRIATPAVRAAPAAALLTACFACGWDDAAAGARDRQPQSVRLMRTRYDPRIRKWPRRTR